MSTRSFVIAGVYFLLGGCGDTHPCKDATIFATVALGPAAATVDSITISFTLDQGTPLQQSFPNSTHSGDATFEVDFPSGYPAGQLFSIEVSAVSGGLPVGSATEHLTLAPGCTAVSLIVKPLPDMSLSDMSSDMSGPDMSKCDAIYVSNVGDDASGGCDPAHPMRTLKAAIASAATRATNIYVCKGEYAESGLALTAPISLHGGYDCATFQRTSQFGYPVYDGINETILTNGGYGTSPDTLLVSGASVGSGVTIDGFTIKGSSASGADMEPAQGSNAVHVAAGAAPQFSDNHIIGGGGTSSGALGSVGMYVEGGSNPEVVRNWIDGGTGTTNSVGVGSVGIYATNSAPHLQQNKIRGGTGTSPVTGGMSAEAVMIVGSGDYTVAAGRAFEGNNIDAVGGACTIPDNPYARAVDFQGSGSLDLIGNAITVSNPNYDCYIRTVYIDSTGLVRILKNRIFGGQAHSSIVGMVGVQIKAAAAAEITNNEILGGNTPAVSAKWPAGILLANVTGPIIRHNTIATGKANYATYGKAMGIFFDSGTVAAVVENNIVVGLGGLAPTPLLFANPCGSAGIIKSLRNNFLFGPDQIFSYGGGPGDTCTAWATYNTLDALATELTGRCTAATPGACTSMGGTTVSGNVTIRSSCSASETGCVVVSGCTSALACIESVFTTWDDASSGMTTLFDAGWLLNSGNPCAVTKSSLDTTAMVKDDAFGAVRTPPPSMGAEEYDGACQ